ncbi:abhydrolase domain-containing protein 16A-like protein [Sarcoptes scabiei]|uniref:Abhydrolase domain-containing protein 16A-like protein n=1 Tax=Sarcoptes scabiei TaxID=52283 RepID=A0A131ZZB0_SARSC|nr:abhydrolase domain-containing protein 16A-like protein [Sarcoptes scabiei]
MSLIDCIFGPSLIRIFDIPVKRYADRIIKLLNLCRIILPYISPILIYNLLKQNHNLNESSSWFDLIRNNSYARLMMTLTSFYLVSYLFRGFSRHMNPIYKQFIREFKSASAFFKSNLPGDEEAKLITKNRDVFRRKYDFDFDQWPIDFRWHQGRYCYDRPAQLLSLKETSEESLNEGPVMSLVSYLMAISVGRLLLYPGSIGILQTVLKNNLITGRHFLIENYNANRYKLMARDNNCIDVIFIDKRDLNRQQHRGNTLVITCEGNAGFYEIGSITTPLNLNYSVIGWNHPGFAGSSGKPYPQNEINAMEVVINFAVSHLDFKLEDIIIFAWSIGGFPAAWAASHYPELKGIIMDASFDDVLPLARSQMMPFMRPIVDATIRNYFNLNISSYLNRYNGPIRFIRRLRDEIIPLDPTQPLLTNRGNYLLKKLLKSRFPLLMANDEVSEEVDIFLHNDNQNPSQQTVLNETKILDSLRDYIVTNQIDQYPIDLDPAEIGIDLSRHILLYMCRKHMSQFDSTHCTPLPPSFFVEPFNLFKSLKLNSSSSTG